MKKRMIAKLVLLSCLCLTACSSKQNGLPNTPEPEQPSIPDAPTWNGFDTDYASLFSPIADEGQYYIPEMKVKPRGYRRCTGVMGYGDENAMDERGMQRGLRHHLLSQSIAGLAHRAIEAGQQDVDAVWFHNGDGNETYEAAEADLKQLGLVPVGDPVSGERLAIEMRSLFNGYVLTDLQSNPESGVVAAVASHVYNSIIVDVRDEEYFKPYFHMTYDARTKSTADAWHEMKDQCSNRALVIMPVLTGQLREYAIKNNLFVLNINKQQGTADGGNNADILSEVLEWLAPGAPVYGWEQGVDEAGFVGPLSESGHALVPSDWTYNHTLLSLLYTERQRQSEQDLAPTIDPGRIDYDRKQKKFVSFLLSDGDNAAWMVNSFMPYLTDPAVAETKMAFPIPSSVLPMFSPTQFYRILNRRAPQAGIIDAMAGGYHYVDNFGMKGDRSADLKRQAERAAIHMRQHRIKILELIALDVRSDRAQEGYKAYIEANDQLEGIVAIQYTPYAEGAGETYWFRNKAGYHIPVVTVKYSIWNYGNQNGDREGSPAYVASRLKAEPVNNNYSAIIVHAWSNFADHGNTANLTIENDANGNIRGAGAAQLCARHFDNSFEVVSLQELIWRIRMNEYPEETKKYLETRRVTGSK